MNKRLHDLMIDATDTSEFIAGNYYWPPEYVEKFAELIVQDVRRLMQGAAEDFILDKNYDAVKGVGRCMRVVREHFGVEQ